jgi:hypothetical protein
MPPAGECSAKGGEQILLLPRPSQRVATVIGQKESIRIFAVSAFRKSRRIIVFPDALLRLLFFAVSIAFREHNMRHRKGS